MSKLSASGGGVVMNRVSKESLLSTVFVDYDNIYLSLKRKNEEAAVRFAKDAGRWVQAIASGKLVTPTNGSGASVPRRIVMNRCYGNPVPRRNAQDNATDMNSFPFVRHHYLRAGFEVIDCPPLTAQLKNSADIRMVMDVCDYLLHDTHFDEFIILSGDADFTPLLHRLRQHARRTVVYANDYTAAPYTAISDGEIREADLIALLMEGAPASEAAPAVSRPAAPKALQSPDMQAEARKAIINEVLATVRAAAQPVLLESLADRAIRVLGHERTVGSAWGGAGSFRDLLAGALPSGVKLSDAAPFYVYDTTRQLAAGSPPRSEERLEPQRQVTRPEPRLDHLPEGFSEIPLERASPAALTHAAPERDPSASQPQRHRPGPAPHQPGFDERTGAPERQTMHPHAAAPAAPRGQPAPAPRQSVPLQHDTGRPAHGHDAARPAQSPDASHLQPAAAETAEGASALQQSIARIHEACQAPPLSPPEYRVLFDMMAREIEANGLTGTRTLVNICDRARELGIDLRKDDARFILEVVSEADPWFEQGVSASLFASRFRNFVVARCKRQGLQLSATELDLIEAWFTGNSRRETSVRQAPSGSSPSGAQSSSGPVTSPQQRSAPAGAGSGYAEGSHHQSPGQPATASDAEWSRDRSSEYRPYPGEQLQARTQERYQERAPERSMDRSPERQPQALPSYGMSGADRYSEFAGAGAEDDEFPRIVRGRLR